MTLRNILCLAVLLLPTSLFAQQTVGLFANAPGQQEGYVLFAPTRSDSTFLIDKCGKLVHMWTANRMPGLSAYLLPDGSLLRTEAVNNPVFSGNGSAGGRIVKYDWNSTVTWSYTLSSTTEIQNHDVCPLPNGNILVAIWEKIDSTDCIAAGRNPALLSNCIWSAKLVELQPSGTNQATIVWQWRLWDHLVQDFDATKSNYGTVSAHPELLNLNYTFGSPTNPDWIHLNAVTYNAALDQVMISTHNLSEIWILDHSTTTTQAAQHNGGAHGKGGDFLYRWGNPAAYNRGSTADQQLFLQHNPTWIPVGLKDENKILIFNNGVGRPGGNAASVDIIESPVDANGDYALQANQPYAPAGPAWTYQAPVPTSFFALAMGGAQRLPGGNTLVCEATEGHFFELDSNENVVWDYINPVGQGGPIAQTTTSTTLGVFRAVWYDAAYSGLAGHTLTAGSPIELNPLPYSCGTQTGIDELPTGQTNSVWAYFTSEGAILVAGSQPLGAFTAILIDLQGRIVDSWSSNKNETMEVSMTLHQRPPSGIYLLKLTGAKEFNLRFFIP